MNRVTTAWLFALASLFGSTAPAQRGGEPIEVSDDDDGRAYRVPVGAAFEVRLPQEVGEPWRWEMRDDPRFITADAPVLQRYGTNRGDREDRVFTVRVTQPGRFPLVFEKLSTFGGYKRSLSRRVSFIIEADGMPPHSPAPGVEAAPPLREGDAGHVIRVPEARDIVILLPFASRLDERWEVIASSNLGLTGPIVEQRDPERKHNIFWLDSNAMIRLRPMARGKAEVTFGQTPAPRDGRAARQLRYRFIVE